MKNILLLFSIMSCCQITAQTDTVQTNNGELVISPILHASMVMQWNDKTFYIDPYGGAEKFAGFPAPDLVLITHVHGDHLNPETLNGLDLAKAELVAPQSVIDETEGMEFHQISVLKNGDNLQTHKINIEAIPMYNLPETDDSRHPKGKGNGYVLTVGGKRIYISGDTEDIDEMRKLENIDIAFVCMNLPYTMTVEQAADAVLEFKPKLVYPFHYRGKNGFSDIEQFQSLVNKGDENIEVRIRDWYPEE